MALKNISKPQTDILLILKENYPGLQIEEEFQIGNKLRLDLFIRSLGIALEYHGRQHFTFVKHFHKTLENFTEARKRDSLKKDRCKELGITIVEFTFQDKITPELVKERFSTAKPLDHYDPGFVIESGRQRRKRQYQDLKQKRQSRKEKERRKSLKFQENPEKKKERLSRAKNTRQQQYRRNKEWQKKIKQKNR